MRKRELKAQKKSENKNIDFSNFLGFIQQNKDQVKQMLETMTTEASQLATIRQTALKQANLSDRLSFILASLGF